LFRLIFVRFGQAEHVFCNMAGIQAIDHYLSSTGRSFGYPGCGFLSDDAALVWFQNSWFATAAGCRYRHADGRIISQ
jgi:hypothetical protein